MPGHSDIQGNEVADELAEMVPQSLLLVLSQLLVYRVILLGIPFLIFLEESNI